MRIVAVLATYNEERFIRACLDHLLAHGVQVYLIDNASTDRTVAFARDYLGRGLAGIETFPRFGQFSWRPLLERKEEVAATLAADWFLHVDADEIRLPPASDQTLASAIQQVDAAGYNAINFQEFVFTPTRESPDHDHRDFQRTMRWYYPHSPVFPHRLNAWKRQDRRVELAWSGGHLVRFQGLRMFPDSFPMRHYLFLSIDHALEKYVGRRYDPAEVHAGWHGPRASLRPDTIRLPSASQLRTYVSDDSLDAARPHAKHFLFDAAWASEPESP